MDSLSALLSTFRLNVDIFHNAQYCGEWAVDTSGAGYISFHLITRGRCYAQSDCLEEPVLLLTGDLILFPRDNQHRLQPQLDCGVTINSVKSKPFSEGWDTDGVGLLCGYFRFSHPLSNPLADLLPRVMVQRAGQGDVSASEILLKLICEEATAARQGGQAALDRLAESLFVLLVREYLDESQNLHGLAAALADARIRRALDAIHTGPEKSWTVDQLASQANMSRSAFAGQFKSLMGESPLQYLSRWRMQLACLWLREENESVYGAAVRCGYESESSFSKAFKKIVGVAPGKFRAAGNVPVTEARVE